MWLREEVYYNRIKLVKINTNLYLKLYTIVTYTLFQMSSSLRHLQKLSQTSLIFSDYTRNFYQSLLFYNMPHACMAPSSQKRYLGKGSPMNLKHTSLLCRCINYESFKHRPQRIFISVKKLQPKLILEFPKKRGGKKSGTKTRKTGLLEKRHHM